MTELETRPEEVAERMGKVRHFMRLPLADRLAVVVAGRMRVIPADTTIYEEGEPCAGMYVLFKGQVHLCKLGPQGQTCIISIIDPVIMFNEVSLLDGGPNPHTAVATQNCMVWHIQRPAYQKILQKYARDQYTQVALGLLDIMAKRYRDLLEDYADLMFLTVPIRVAKLIYELSENGRIAIDRRAVSINEMAARISTVPEAISRALHFLKCQGIIATDRSTITVLRKDELEHLANLRA